MTRRSRIALASAYVLLLGAIIFFVVEANLAHAFAGHQASSWQLSPDSSFTAGRVSRLPSIVFWAWERPEDLRFLSSKQAAVAFLAKTIYLPSAAADLRSNAAATLSVRPRLQPLRIAPGTQLIAVVRIESMSAFQSRGSPSRIALRPQSNFDSPALLDNLASEVADLQFLPVVSAIQIDFDATTSEHPFYAALLQSVRKRLPGSVPLSITALASWCIGDPWLNHLPSGTLDEAVPNAFPHGPGLTQRRGIPSRAREFPSPCLPGQPWSFNPRAALAAALER